MPTSCSNCHHEYFWRLSESVYCYPHLNNYCILALSVTAGYSPPLEFVSFWNANICDHTEAVINVMIFGLCDFISISAQHCRSYSWLTRCWLRRSFVFSGGGWKYPPLSSFIQANTTFSSTVTTSQVCSGQNCLAVPGEERSTGAALQGHFAFSSISHDFFTYVPQHPYPSVTHIVKPYTLTTDAHTYAYKCARTFQRPIHSNSLTLQGQDFQVINLHCDRISVLFRRVTVCLPPDVPVTEYQRIVVFLKYNMIFPLP